MPKTRNPLADYGSIKPSPRNALIGYAADALGAINDYANMPDLSMPMGKANPVLSLLAGMTPLNALAVTANRMSYGDPLTKIGKANAPLLKPETAEAAMASRRRGSGSGGYLDQLDGDGMMADADVGRRAPAAGTYAPDVGRFAPSRFACPVPARLQQITQRGCEHQPHTPARQLPADGRRPGRCSGVRHFFAGRLIEYDHCAVPAVMRGQAGERAGVNLAANGREVGESHGEDFD